MTSCRDVIGGMSAIWNINGIEFGGLAPLPIWLPWMQPSQSGAGGQLLWALLPGVNDGISWDDYKQLFFVPHISDHCKRFASCHMAFRLRQAEYMEIYGTTIRYSAHVWWSPAGCHYRKVFQESGSDSSGKGPRSTNFGQPTAWVHIVHGSHMCAYILI